MESSDTSLLGLAVFGVLLSSILEDPSVTGFVAPRVAVAGVDCFEVPSWTVVDDGFLVPTTTMGDVRGLIVVPILAVGWDWETHLPSTMDDPDGQDLPREAMLDNKP